MYDKTSLDTSPSVNPFLEAALQYAGRGWPVMPLHSPGGTGKDGCSCGSMKCPGPAKHPRIKGGKNWANASADPKQIEAWWRRWPDANIAVVTGQRSGLIVIDIDGPAGFAQYQQLGALYGALPNTAFVTTGRGAHIYMQCKIVCAGSVIGDGVDVRGEGNYVVAPPSVHITGRVYQWGKSYAR